MKVPWKGWFDKKLSSPWIQGHDDPQISRHVKKAPRQDADTSEVLGRLPTDTEEWDALSQTSSHKGQNGVATTTNVSTMGEFLMAGAKYLFKDVSKYMSKDTERDQTSSRSDTSSMTRVEPSPQSGSFTQDTKYPEIGQFSSTNYGLPRSNGELKRRNSPSLIQKISPDGHVEILLDLRLDHPALETTSERPDPSKSISDEEDHLGPFYNDFYHLPPILEIPVHSGHLESKSDTEDPFEPVLHFPDNSRNPPDEKGHLQQLREEQSDSEYPLIKQIHQVLESDGPVQSKFIWDRSHAKSTISDAQDFPERKLYGQGYRAPISRQENYSEPVSEPIWEGNDNSRRDSDSRGHFDSPLIGTDNSTPISVWPDQTQSIAREDFGGPISEFIQDRQSRPESFRSGKSLMVKDQQRRRRHEARLHNLLSRSLQTRARAYETRSQLRQSRFEVSNADEAFMKLVRERRFQGSQDDLALQESFKKLQDARDRYGPLEEAYNEVEEHLNREEYEAKELKNKILKSEISSPDFEIDSRSSRASETDSEVSRFSREVYPPLYEAYLSRLGDADLCRETIAEMMNEHENLLHAQEQRRRVRTELSPDDQITLGNFPAAQAKLLDELARIEEDVELLRLQCAREGLLGEYEAESEGENGVENEFEVEAEATAEAEGGGEVEGESEDEGKRESKIEEINLSEGLIGSVDPEQNKYEKYPLLLEKPQEKEDDNNSKVLLTDFNEGDVGDRITCWLLHKLRSSGLEVELLASFTDGLDRNSDTGKWQQEVLNFWFIDSANLPPSAYEAEPSLTAFPASPTSDVNKGYHKHFGNKYLIQLVVSSSALSRKLEFGMRLKLIRMKGRSAITV